MKFFLKIDYFLFFFLLIISTFSLIILLSATSKNVNLIYRTIINILVSFFFMIIFSNINKKNYEKYSFYIYFFSLFLLILVYFFGISCKGSKRWINLFYLKFQPSELSTISISLMLSYFIKNKGYPDSTKSIFLYFLIIIIPSILIVIQPDLGLSIITIISGLSTLFISGIRYKNVFKLFLFFVILFILNWFFLMKDYQKNRIISLFNENYYKYGLCYHIIQSKVAIGSGGILGKGLFNGTQSHLKFVPELHTDFIFSIIAEELGLLGVFFIIFIYSCIICRMIFILNKGNDIFFKIFSFSLLLNICINILINISMVIGIIPVVGIPLPLISYGGSSMLSTFVKIGIIMSNNNKNNNKNNFIFYD